MLVAFWQLRHTFVWAERGGEFFEYSSLSIYVGDIGAIILICLFLIGGGKWQIGSDKGKLLLPLGLLLVWMMVGAMWSVDPMVTLYWAGQYLLWLVVGLGILPRVFPLRQAVVWLSVGVMFSTVVGISQNIRNVSLGWLGLGETPLDPSKLGVSVVVVEGVRKLRAYGLTPHPNILGGLVVWMVGWIVATIKTWNWGWVVGISVLMGGLVLSFARGGWIALLVILIITGVWGFVRKIKFLNRIVLLISLIFGLLLAWQSGAVLGRVDISTFDGLENRSIEDRLTTYSRWFGSLDIPDVLIGVGQGNYVQNLAQNIPSLSWWELQPVHNSYMLWLAQVGVVGLVLSGWIGWLLIRRFRLSRDLMTYLPLVGLGVVGVFDHWVVSLHQGVVAVCLALALIFWEEDI